MFNLKVDSYHVQKSTDGFELILFDGSNVIETKTVKSVNQGHFLGEKAVNNGLDSDTIEPWNKKPEVTIDEYEIAGDRQWIIFKNGCAVSGYLDENELREVIGNERANKIINKNEQ